MWEMPAEYKKRERSDARRPSEPGLTEEVATHSSHSSPASPEWSVHGLIVKARSRRRGGRAIRPPRAGFAEEVAHRYARQSSVLPEGALGTLDHTRTPYIIDHPPDGIKRFIPQRSSYTRRTSESALATPQIARRSERARGACRDPLQCLKSQRLRPRRA